MSDAEMPDYTFTATDVARTAYRIAKENPDKVYITPAHRPVAACLYVHRSTDGTLVPGCLFGAALMELGVPAERMLSRQLAEDAFNAAFAKQAGEALE